MRASRLARGSASVTYARRGVPSAAMRGRYRGAGPQRAAINQLATVPPARSTLRRASVLQIEGCFHEVWLARGSRVLSGRPRPCAAEPPSGTMSHRGSEEEPLASAAEREISTDLEREPT